MISFMLAITNHWMCLLAVKSGNQTQYWFFDSSNRQFLDLNDREIDEYVKFLDEESGQCSVVSAQCSVFSPCLWMRKVFSVQCSVAVCGNGLRSCVWVPSCVGMTSLCLAFDCGSGL